MLTITLLLLTIFNAAQSCDIIISLMSEDRIVLVDRVLEDYHTCLKCVDSEGNIDPTTEWQVFVNGNPLSDETAVDNLNGTLILLFPRRVVPNDGRNVDVVANCYTPDQTLNRNVSLYSLTFLSPAVQNIAVERTRGEPVTFACTNNNPPTLATAISWVQNEEVLESLSLVDSTENTVTYSTVAEENGVYQCQVLSTGGTVLVVNVTLTVNEATGGAVQVKTHMFEFIALYVFLPIFLLGMNTIRK